MIFKNVASQGVYIFAYDKTTGAAKTGDAANITASISKDGAAGAGTATTNPTEIGGGTYWYPLSQAETNCNAFAIYPASATSNILINPIIGFTTGAFAYANLDATVSSRSTYAGADTAGTTTLLGRLTAGRATNLDNLDATISGIAASVWAAATRTLTAFGFTVNANADPNVALIKAKTDNLPASPAAVSDIPTANANADALLKRDWTAVSGEAARSVLNALRFLRNKWSVASTTLTVTKEDDTTAAWTAAVTTDATAQPVTGSDPA